MSGGEISRGLYDIGNIILYGIFGAKFDIQKNEFLIENGLKIGNTMISSRSGTEKTVSSRKELKLAQFQFW